MEVDNALIEHLVRLAQEYQKARTANMRQIVAECIVETIYQHWIRQ